MDTRTANKPVVRVKVYIDGDEAWSVDVLGQPLPRALGRRGADAVEGAVGSLGKGLRELVEWSRAWVRRSWFS